MGAAERPDVPGRRQARGAAGSRHPRGGRTLLGLAWRESRTARSRLLLYMSSISLGVAALVAIDSYAGNVTRSIRENARSLLGGDVAFTARVPFPARADSLLDSIARSGAPIARQTSFASMAVAARTGNTRLVQVRAVTPNYPLYGTVVTEPAGRWGTLRSGPHALVDPSLLIALDARVGDTLALGYGRFEIAGELRVVPGDPGVAAIIGPRVFIPASYVPETQLLGLGSRAEYEATIRLPDGTSADRWVQPLRPRLERIRVRARTVAQTETGLTDAVQRLSDFLGVVGLIALLLGGIGVASGVHAFVTRKIDTVAVLRCLGATSRQVLLIYVTQAAAMGFLGALVGVVAGVAIQFILPNAASGVLPVDVNVRLEPSAIGFGLFIGVWVALAFALRPLLALRSVSPLQALRRDDSGATLRIRWRDWPSLVVNAVLVLSIVLLTTSRAPSTRNGLLLAGGIAATLVLLWLSATSLAWLARRAVRAGWPYVVRQGVANLYRPANQTRAVVLSLGFGAFLVTTLYLVQTNLLRQFAVTADASRANLLFFDIQEDQAPGIDSLVRTAGYPVLERTPIVTMRIAAINGTEVRTPASDSLAEEEEIAGDSAGEAAATERGPEGRSGGRRGGGPSGWAVRREYRSTFRDSVTSSERITSGRWFGARAANDSLYEVSMERDVAGDLGLELGDQVTWDVQGVRIATRVTSFREVNWARFEPNFFAVFEPGALEQAPKQFVLLARAPSRDAVARLQRATVARFPNVSSVDLSLVLETVDQVVSKVTVAIRFMAVFSLALGVPVLFSAVAATRRQRVREGVLLRTLGATRDQVRKILLSEYALLGILGSLTGMVLAFGGAWGLMRYVFDGPFVAAWAPAVGIAAMMTVLTLLIGLLSGRDVFRETPIAALREA